MSAKETKSQILSAALELFALNGYEKTTMRQIAKKVGIRSASIYYFYDSKESLLESIFSEFESTFSKYRNSPEKIFEAAKKKPLSEVLSMVFYTFGSPLERDRMMTISRVILSLQYENADAQKLFEKVVVHDALEYGVKIFKGLHSMGKIKQIDFKWTSYIFHSFAIAVFEENLRQLKTYEESSRDYEDGIKYLSKQFAGIISKKD